MVYKWEAHKEICRRLYVDEKMSFRAIAAHMKEHHNFGARYVHTRSILAMSLFVAHRTQLPTLTVFD